MIDEIWKREEIESPCVKICILHRKENICIGCFRTANEIEQWSLLSKEERNSIKAELQTRANQIRPKRQGGRASRLNHT